MLELNDKTIFITGASSGIGKACAEQFATAGAKLILTARRLERIQQLALELKQKYAAEILTLELDIQEKEQIAEAIKSLPPSWKTIDILLNNAGIALSSVKFQDGNIEDWDTMINTNFRGMLYVTHAILPGMLARNKGHIINIGSTAGHDYYPAGNVYSATKHAVKAISKSLRIDLLGTAIRVTQIDPGLTQTEFTLARWKNDESRAKEFYTGFTPLQAADIAEAVLFCASRPSHVDVAEMLVYPTDQAAASYLYKNGQESKNLF